MVSVEKICTISRCGLFLALLLFVCVGVNAQSDNTSGVAPANVELKEPVEDADGFMRHLPQDEFDEELEDSYLSTYRLYKGLSDKSRSEVYASYQAGKSVEELRKMIMARFSKDRLSR